MKDEMLSKQLKDEEFKGEYEVIQPEMDIIRAENMGMVSKIEFVPKQNI